MDQYLLAVENFVTTAAARWPWWILACGYLTVLLGAFIGALGELNKKTSSPLKIVVFFGAAVIWSSALYFAIFIAFPILLSDLYYKYFIYGFFAAWLAAALIINASNYYKRRQAERARRAARITWQISSWQMDDKGDFKSAPVLAINGQKYIFSTPTPYIKLFEQMMRKGCRTDSTIKWFEHLRHSKTNRENLRIAAGLALDEEDCEIAPIPNLSKEDLDIVEAACRSPVEPAPEPSINYSISSASPDLSQVALAQGMALKLKRSQSHTTFGSLLFILDARLEVSAEVQHHINRYGLGGHIVYESAERQKHQERMAGHLEASRDKTSMFAPANEQAKGIGRTMWRLGRATVSATRASLALRITVSSLIAGVHVECKTMDELLEAENAIREAARNLKGYLETASTFTGQEEVIEI